jgi:hypothetical protein
LRCPFQNNEYQSRFGVGHGASKKLIEEGENPSGSKGRIHIAAFTARLQKHNAFIAFAAMPKLK